MAPVTAAAAAASAAAAADDDAEQRERAVFLQLVATNGGGDLSAVVLATGRPVVLGRSREADIQVKDRKASGRHCSFALDPDDGTLHVEDLRSTNGTYVGGSRIDAGPLRAGDTLGVGTSTWRVELDELVL
jgi:pSer/pThr/pTyr-binding forkhead associated (FHA) protein